MGRDGEEGDFVSHGFIKRITTYSSVSRLVRHCLLSSGQLWWVREERRVNEGVESSQFRFRMRFFSSPPTLVVEEGTLCKLESITSKKRGKEKGGQAKISDPQALILLTLLFSDLGSKVHFVVSHQVMR